MGKLTELKRLGAEDMEGADKVVVETLLPFQNSFNEDVYNRLNGDVGVANTNNAIKDVKLVHGVEKIVKNPLSDKRIRPVGVYCLGTDGLPLAGSVQWRNMANDQVGITVHFDNSEESTGQIGQILGPITRLFSNTAGAPLTSGTPADVCTTPSLTLTPGKWRVRAAVGFVPTATTSVTQVVAAVSDTSATLPNNDTIAVPTDGEDGQRWSTAANVLVNITTIPIPGYRVTVADGATLPLFLVARATFTASTMTCFGSMEAIREVPYRTGLTATCKLYFVGG